MKPSVCLVFVNFCIFPFIFGIRLILATHGDSSVVSAIVGPNYNPCRDTTPSTCHKWFGPVTL